MSDPFESLFIDEEQAADKSNVIHSLEYEDEVMDGSPW